MLDLFMNSSGVTTNLGMGNNSGVRTWSSNGVYNNIERLRDIYERFGNEVIKLRDVWDDAGQKVFELEFIDRRTRHLNYLQSLETLMESLGAFVDRVHQWDTHFMNELRR